MHPMQTSFPLYQMMNLCHSVSMKHWQCLGFPGTYRCSHLMNRHISETVSCSKCYPKLLDIQFRCCCNRQDNYIIRIHCMQSDFLKTFVDCII